VSERWARVGELFHRALELEGDARERWLDEGSAGDRTLYKEVRELLQAHDRAGSFLESPLVASAPLAPGFELQRELGRGSFATVYLALDKSLGRRVALKIAPAGGSEARTLAALEHEHIVRVFSESIDEASGKRLVAMQYVPGGTLQALREAARALQAATGRWPSFLDALAALPNEGVGFDPALLRERDELRDADLAEGFLRIGMQLCDALAHAHGQGILHLDIKPANILITPFGRALLTDFNISTSLESLRSGTARGLGGTPRYMAPEQRALFAARTDEERTRALKAIDEGADLHSLGAVLQELLGEAAPGLRLTLEPRPRHAQELRSALQAALALYRLEKAMPRAGRLERFAGRAPLTALVLAALLPQAAGTSSQYAYAFLRVATRLGADQQRAFHQLMLFFNGLVYPLAIVAFVFWALPVRKLRNSAMSAEESARARTRLFAVPRIILWITSAGWLPAIPLFPFSVGWLSHPTPTAAWIGFGSSFLLAALIATPYSLLFTQYLLVRVLYPRLLAASHGRIAPARAQLRPIERTTRIIPVVAALVPMIGAALAVLGGADEFSPERFKSFQILVVLLIGAGIAGLLLSQKLAGEIERMAELYGD
jgi:hypothetical protein